MSFSSDPFFQNLILAVGGLLLGAAGLWNLSRPPRPRGWRVIARTLFSMWILLAAVSATWTGTSRLLTGDFGSSPTLPALANLAPPAGAPAFDTIAGLPFHRDIRDAREESRTSGRPLFIDFYATWCDPCRKWEADLARDPRFQAVLKEAVLARIQDTDAAFTAFQDHPAHWGLRIGLPYYVVIDADARIRYQSNDYRDTAGMITAILNAAPAR